MPALLVQPAFSDPGYRFSAFAPMKGLMAVFGVIESLEYTVSYAQHLLGGRWSS